jgi:hypothetical protein
MSLIYMYYEMVGLSVLSVPTMEIVHTKLLQNDFFKIV